jgi:hypothetical protein
LQALRQLLFRLSRAIKQRRHLLGQFPDGPAIRRSPYCLRARLQDRRGRPAHRRQPLPPGQLIADHPRYQAVHDDGLAVYGESQQSLVSQPGQRLIDHDRGGAAPAGVAAARQGADPLADIEQFPANPRRGQHGHDLQQLAAHPFPVGAPGHLQGQRYCRRHAGRIGFLVA